MNRVRFQYMSNLRLGKRDWLTYSMVNPVPNSTLLLLGNIGHVKSTQTQRDAENGELKSFLSTCSDYHKHIIWVPGSMEYSSSPEHPESMAERIDAMRAFLKESQLSRVSLGLKSQFEYGNTTLLTTTLWDPDADYSSDPLYSFDSTSSSLKPVTRKVLQKLCDDEMRWLLTRICKTTGTVVTATHLWPKLEQGKSKESLLLWFNTFTAPTIQAILYGRPTTSAHLTRTIAKSRVPELGKELPFEGINMGQHSGFVSNMMLELSTERKNTMYL